eukprot:SAG31_NODE_32098_length_360_cov_0.747126_1_plen_50_part_10
MARNQLADRVLIEVTAVQTYVCPDETPSPSPAMKQCAPTSHRHLRRRFLV